jgi:hypothetical protein
MINLLAFFFILAMMCTTLIISGGNVGKWYVPINIFCLLIQVPFIVVYFKDKG